MQAISSQIIINSIRSRRDGSLGFSAETPELTSDEKVAFMEMQGRNLQAVFSPTDEHETNTVEVKKELDSKTQSQRLRGVLFVYAKQNGLDPNEYYYSEMDKIINHYKGKLE